MKKIKNPHDIIDAFVSDYKSVFEERLISIVMYGSAVTHEYKPRESDINTVIIVSDNSIAQISKCLNIQEKWKRYRVTTPFYMTPEFIRTASDTYPLEFIDIRSNYRVLFGDDLFQKLEIKLEHVRLQCERELRGISLHLRRSYVDNASHDKILVQLLKISISRLVPIFKGLLILKSTSIPKSKADIISSVEDSFKLGASVLSRIYLSDSKKLRNQHDSLFESYSQTIDKLITLIDLQERGVSQ